MRKLIVALTVGALVLGLTVTALGAVKRKPTRRTIKADPRGGLMFSKTTLSARHGRVILTMKNPKSSGLPHGIAVEGHGVDKDGKVVNPGRASRVSVKLSKGTYTYYCPFDGHKAAGMTGKLVVK